jgi:hypothetical protein
VAIAFGGDRGVGQGSQQHATASTSPGEAGLRPHIGAHAFRVPDLRSAVDCYARKATAKGWGKLKSLPLGAEVVHRIADPGDKETIVWLLASRNNNGYHYAHSAYLSADLYEGILPRASERGQLRLGNKNLRDVADASPLRFAGSEPFQFLISAELQGKSYTLQPVFQR